MRVHAHVVVSGAVQGVWFRASTQRKAEELGLKGWVRNTPDGCVEAVFEGDKSRVEDMITWCHQGPPAAQVENVTVNFTDFSGAFSGFAVRY
jgi:acylphosphatase